MRTADKAYLRQYGLSRIDAARLICGLVQIAGLLLLVAGFARNELLSLTLGLMGISAVVGFLLAEPADPARRLSSLRVSIHGIAFACGIALVIMAVLLAL